jgi:hypothetical protein
MPLGHYMAMTLQLEQANTNVFSFEEEEQKCGVCCPHNDIPEAEDEEDE